MLSLLSPLHVTVAHAALACVANQAHGCHRCTAAESCRDLSDSYECSFVCARGNIRLSRGCDMKVLNPPTGQGRRDVNVGGRADRATPDAARLPLRALQRCAV